MIEITKTVPVTIRVNNSGKHCDYNCHQLIANLDYICDRYNKYLRKIQGGVFTRLTDCIKEFGMPEVENEK